MSASSRARLIFFKHLSVVGLLTRCINTSCCLRKPLLSHGGGSVILEGRVIDIGKLDSKHVTDVNADVGADCVGVLPGEAVDQICHGRIVRSDSPVDVGGEVESAGGRLEVEADGLGVVVKTAPIVEVEASNHQI